MQDEQNSLQKQQRDNQKGQVNPAELEDPDAANASDQIEEEASLEDQLPSAEIEMENQEDITVKIRRLNEKTEALHADEQFLKEELKVREQQTLSTYNTLIQKKRLLTKLVSQAFNRNSASVDIGLTEQLDELRSFKEKQQLTIEQLIGQIAKKGIIIFDAGIEGVHNDESVIKMKNKAEDIQSQIKVGRKFSSTQYVRDYLERPQAYYVSYEQAKYEYELRVRIKECLEQQKKLYQKKKQQINSAKKRERELEQQLHKEKDLLMR